MSPWYGGNQTATPPPSYSTYATTSCYTDVFKYYTTKAPEFYTTTYAAPSHYTDALKYNKTSSTLVVTLLQPNVERCDEDRLNRCMQHAVAV
ncbi:hypothetical protein DAPPUDRAFT_311548 [Daphnia pulex]|uniref:Uncharacterized protein n=1 Tax=Daphnia pulex TaxID=6669 RepID=E9FX80_DAPPU|nr:hypothetical protein DAPPUDRAFT_311548 [Daphnia pulex]|eukprot:EFX88316.1 hypothetical protein DAPPUDRAFT_311548 [Daphnia pulex]